MSKCAAAAPEYCCWPVIRRPSRTACDLKREATMKLVPLELLRFLLDPERLDPLSHELVGVILLRIREPGPRLRFDEQAPVGETRLQERAGGMADDCHRLSGLVEVPKQGMHGIVSVERVHGSLSADCHQAVVVVDAHVGEWLRVGDELRVLGRVDEAERDQIIRGVPALICLAPFAQAILVALGTSGAATRKEGVARGRGTSPSCSMTWAELVWSANDRHRAHTVPPFTRTFCAVIQCPRSLARNATTAAISSGRPRRPKADIASRLARNSSLLPMR
jgi:hypothetical protein